MINFVVVTVISCNFVSASVFKSFTCYFYFLSLILAISFMLIIAISLVVCAGWFNST